MYCKDKILLLPDSTKVVVSGPGDEVFGPGDEVCKWIHAEIEVNYLSLSPISIL